MLSRTSVTRIILYIHSTVFAKSHLSIGRILKIYSFQYSLEYKSHSKCSTLKVIASQLTMAIAALYHDEEFPALLLPFFMANSTRKKCRHN